MSQQRLVEAFMRAFGQDVPARPTLEDYPFELRMKLIREEYEEFVAACEARDIVEMMDALADLLYVTHGAASAAGVDLDPIFEEVHNTNMAKLGPDGKPIRREDGKVLKPDDWKPPRIKDLIDFQIRNN